MAMEGAGKRRSPEFSMCLMHLAPTPAPTPASVSDLLSSPSTDKASQVIADAKAGDKTAIIMASVGLGLMISLFALGIYVVVTLKRKVAALSGGGVAAQSRKQIV